MKLKYEILANHVSGSYRITTGFIPDRSFVHIKTMRNDMVRYDLAYYTRVNTSRHENRDGRYFSQG